MTVRWQFPEQDGTTVVMTEPEILDHYYTWWSAQMLKVGKLLLATEQSCIEDWVVVHWAWREPDGPHQTQ